MEKILSLMVIYWFSLIIFIIAKCIDGSGYSIQEIIKNVSLYSFSINNNAWYMSFYILALLSIFLLQKINAKWWISLVFSVVCVPVNFLIEQNNVSLPFSLSSYFIYIPLVLFGYYLNGSLFNRMYSFLHKGNKGLFLSIILLFVTLWLRVITGSDLYGFRFIWVYAPFIYLSLAAIISYLTKYELTNIVISNAGGYTTEVWLLHGLFTAPILWTQKICFMPKVSILIFIWELLLTVMIAQLYKSSLSRYFEMKIRK